MGDLTALAIDIGKGTFGWALGKNGIIQSSGEVSPNTKGAHPGQVWLNVRDFLYNHRHVDEIYHERVKGLRGAGANMAWGAFVAEIDVHILVHKILRRTLTPAEVKEDFTGYGNADKFMMCDVAMNLGWKKGTRGTDFLNNEADACAIYWVMCTRGNIRPSFLR